MSTTFYTVHEHPGRADPDARVVFVKQGYNWLGLVSPLLWCLYRLQWLAFLAYLAASLAVAGVAMAIGTGEDGAVIAGLGVNVLFGFLANDARRFSLARGGYQLVDIAGGGSLAEAELRFFRGRSGVAAPRASLRPGPESGLALFPTSQG
ncbi:MAG: DUF2628 domain-containing protein [Alphaproteobacteria bacterium]|nr:DUF2628 domain-containing protein [Alphaproteobacteria bacterium]